MDAQAMEKGEPSAWRSSPPFAVRWRWSVLLLIGLLALAGVNGAILAEEVRVRAIETFVPLPICRSCTPEYPSPVGLMFTAAFAIVLATIAASPAIVVLVLLGRRVGVRPSALTATALLAGVLALSVAARLVTWTSRALDAGEPGAMIAGSVVGPTIEEAVKAAAILLVGLAMGWRLGVRAGIVLGAAVGLIVTILEIALYVQLNVTAEVGSGYGSVIAIRLGLFGLGLHVVASAIAGAGVGAWLAQDPPRRPRVLVGCLAAAIAVHGVWNLVGPTVMTSFAVALYPNPDLGVSEPFPQSVLFVASSVTQLVVLAIPIAAIVVAWRRDAARAASGGATLEVAPS